MNWTRGTLLGTLVLAVAAPLPGKSGQAAPAILDSRGAPQLGDARPALEVETPEGDLVNDARVAGRPLVVDFFATWCAPCRSALADLNAARREANVDVQFVLIDLGESRAVVRDWAAAATLPPRFLLALDPDGVAARRWGANRLPTTFLIDATGVVRHINRGWGPGYRERLTRWLRNIAQPARTAP
jgi:thiol-disulfide isomerase/thioredoxin